MVRLFYLLIAAFLILGCSPGTYEMLSRTTDDPVAIRPKVESFLESNVIFINWDYDAAADEYILERAYDSPSLVFETIYSGKDLEYVDRDLGEIEGQRFLYRLKKRRGKETFGPSHEALGVNTVLINDPHGHNTKETALQLETINFIANMYYYRSYNGVELYNEHWYFIEIPPIRRATFVIVDSQAAAGDENSHFRYFEYERGDHVIKNQLAYYIENPELETQRLYFKVYPNKFQFVGQTLPGGGKLVNYEISIGNIEPR